MSFSSFLKLVEIQTKVASIIPFLLGTVYTLYNYNNFSIKNFLFMFISLLAFDMTATAVNNYYDYKRAKKTKGYNYETHNAIVRDKLSERKVIGTIIFLLITAIIFGILLFLNTSIVILLLGAISFIVGIFYSAGPLPINRTPFGEIFSGFFMGFIIVFISVYIHVYDLRIVNILYESGMLNVRLDISEIISIFLISLPAVVGIANIMLANNICDIEDDIENKRYTLPINIGRKKALLLFKSLYYIAYIDILLLVILKIIPFISLIILLTFILINKNIKLFLNKQTKKDTFVLAVKNFVLINITYILTFIIAFIFKL
ncbi:MAG: 1,4-dihydroxy-2-naphthoate polyprenyltransferase [Firmicutes bacterium]|nr:1,4-dihydroxy-2-naphthoate polyprenyltransferase [Bacillota bacterium]